MNHNIHQTHYIRFPFFIFVASIACLAAARAYPATPVILEPPADLPTRAASPEDEIVLADDFKTNPAESGWTALEITKDERRSIDLEWVAADGEGGARSISASRGIILSPEITPQPCTVYRLRFRGRVEPAEAEPDSRAVIRGWWGMRFYDRNGRLAWENIYRGSFDSHEWLRYGAKMMCPYWVVQIQVSFWPDRGARIFIDDVELAIDAEANAFDKETPPPIPYDPEPDRLRHLPKTMDKLRNAQKLKVVILGDSIANDLSTSGFPRMIEELYPGSQIELIHSIRGSVGWEYFSGDDVFPDAVEKHDPDLVIASGMSDRDVVHLRNLVNQIRKRTNAEPLILNGQVCQTYHLIQFRPPPPGCRIPVGSRERLRSEVIETGREMGFAMFNLGGVFDQFIYESEIPMEWWQRDTSHLNDRGKHLIGRMLALFFDPSAEPKPAPADDGILFHEDFEADPAAGGWTVSEDFDGEWIHNDAYSGLRSVRMTRGLYKSPNWAVEPLAMYRVRFASKAPGGAYWSVIGFKADGELVGGTCSGVKSSQWKLEEFFFIGPANATTAQFWFHPFSSEYRFDDLHVEKATIDQWHDWAEGLYAKLPPVEFAPPEDRWLHLPKTREKILRRQPLRMLIIGDSVANDLGNSDFHLLLNHHFDADVTLLKSVSGNAGCDWYMQEDRVQNLILANEPDLLIIAGMSNSNASDVRQLVKQVRARSDAEILLLSGTVVQEAYWKGVRAADDGGVPISGRTALRRELAAAAHQDSFAFFDLGGEWDRYIINSPAPLASFMRDNSHVNTCGRMIYSRLMLHYFDPDDRLLTPEASSSETNQQPLNSTGKSAASESGDTREAEPLRWFEAEVTLLRGSIPMTVEQAHPYTEAYRTVEYRVDKLIDGELNEKTILAVVQSMSDRRQLPAATHQPGARFRVRLGLWEQQPELENYPVAHHLEAWDAAWYYVAEYIGL